MTISYQLDRTSSMESLAQMTIKQLQNECLRKYLDINM